MNLRPFSCRQITALQSERILREFQKLKSNLSRSLPWICMLIGYLSIHRCSLSHLSTCILPQIRSDICFVMFGPTYWITRKTWKGVTKMRTDITHIAWYTASGLHSISVSTQMFSSIKRFVKLRKYRDMLQYFKCDEEITDYIYRMFHSLFAPKFFL
jgi:hypothetical protein